MTPSFEQAPRLAHAHLALVRIDAGERHHDVGVFAGRVRDLFVGNPPRADLELGVDREHHEADLALAIVGDGLGDRRPLAGLEILRGRILERLPHFVRLVAARDLGVGMDVDGDQVLDVHGCAPLAGFCRSHSAMLMPRSTSSTSSGAGSQCMGPKMSR